jgi:hypothetical protein
VIALRRSVRRSGGRGWWIVGSLWMYWLEKAVCAGRRARPERKGLDKFRVAIGVIFIGIATFAAQYKCRASAKFGARMLLIYLRLQNRELCALLQHGKLFPGGTPKAKSGNEGNLQARANRGSTDLRDFWFFLSVLFQIAVQAGPANA